MESIETLLNQVILSQKQKKNKQQKQQLKTKTNMTDQLPKESFLVESPLSPIFKPLKSPTDLLSEINLPLSDLSTDENEEFHSSNNSKEISYPGARQLNVFFEGNFLDKSAEFEMIEADFDQKLPPEESNHQDNSKPTAPKVSILQFLDKKAL